MIQTRNSAFFSIIIPTYNRAEFIENTLQTVFGQKYSDYEVIVVDNCSTDNTKEILQTYIDDGRIKFIQHDKNYERAKSRNTGMQHANGEFVTFLDSDDFMYPNNLYDAFQFVQENPDCKLFHNLYELVNEERKPIYQYPITDVSNSLQQIIVGNFLSCIGVFLHRDIYSGFKFNEDKQLTGSEDWEFWLRIIPHYPELGQIRKVNSGILHHPGRTVNHQDLSNIIERKRFIFNNLLKDDFYRSVYEKERHRFFSNIYIYAAIIANQYALFSKAISYNIKALTLDYRVLFKLRFIKSLANSVLRR